ncbi:hypothetical protein ACSL103130_05505 [Actinomyces slackii]|uniref:Uncharacterized protein n=1 Tax=Actinomyces slackii TaxID=52774 RepID=A0A448KCX1_9ACTO|nr:Uncharacterised protein [Actinomyces slackii]
MTLESWMDPGMGCQAQIRRPPEAITWRLMPVRLRLPDYRSCWSFQDQHDRRVPSMM